MKKIACELSLANGGDVIAMVELDEQGVLHVPPVAAYGSFSEGVLRCQVMRPEDAMLVKRQSMAKREVG